MDDFFSTGFHPSGFHPSAGTRYPKAPIDIETTYIQPIIKNVLETPYALIKLSPSGIPIIAPPPKPIIAIPVAKPLLSGNHLINVDTGDI